MHPSACYDRGTIHAIIDSAYCCHIAFSDDRGIHCIPTACWREEDYLYIHGSNASRMIQVLAQGVDTSVCVTHIDDIVLAEAAFDHTMNYRSVVVHGRFHVVPDAQKRPAMERFMDHMVPVPGRRLDIAPPTDRQMGATSVLRLPLADAAAKLRSGPPKQVPERSAAAWTGVLPFSVVKSAPETAPACSVSKPQYVSAWQSSSRQE